MISLTNIMPYEYVYIYPVYTHDGQRRVMLAWTERGNSYQTSVTTDEAHKLGFDLQDGQRIVRPWAILENMDLAAVINTA